jgi:hypothetical protein
VEKYGRAGQATDDNITRCMSIACWLPKATDTHSEYIILIAFSLQQWFRERASLLCPAYIACLVLFSDSSQYKFSLCIVVHRRALVLHTWEATGSNFSRQICCPDRYFSWFFPVPAFPCHSDKNYLEGRGVKKSQPLVIELWYFCVHCTVFGTGLINKEATH